MRQLSFGLLDMGWHGQDPTAITDVKLWNRTICSHKTIPRSSRKRNEYRILSYLQGGYSSGYYSYKWGSSDADAFEYFQEKGFSIKK
jgi:peptidyl-dipeptidase Dcp